MVIASSSIGLALHPSNLTGSGSQSSAGTRGIPKGAALGAPLVTFSATGKSPGVEGRSALPMGVVGAFGPHLGGAQRRALALLASGFAGANGRPLPIKKPEATFRFCSHIIRKRKSVRTQNAKRSDLP